MAIPELGRKPNTKKRLLDELEKAGEEGRTNVQLCAAVYGVEDYAAQGRIVMLVAAARRKGSKIELVRDHGYSVGRYVLKMQ
jgi:hypothetical protein